MENFWDYNVWGFVVLLGVLLGSLLVANILKRVIRPLRKSLIPTSVLGGLLLLIISTIFKAITGNVMFDSVIFAGKGMTNLEIITYHTLALGFTASAFKTTGGKLTKQRSSEIINTGVTTVSTYLLQGILGLAITMITAFIIKGFFVAAGILLPFGYGQGTGQALNYGNIYQTQFGFSGGRSFGLTIAALGFLCASIGGVIHLNVARRRNKLVASERTDGTAHNERIESPNEIPMQESIDKLTVQIALICVAYLLAYVMMAALGSLFPGMRAVIYGFNFLLGVLAGTVLKLILNTLYRKRIMRKKFTNNFLMTRISNFFFDIMIVAGIAAIRLDLLEDYWGVILILGAVGAVATYLYNRIVARKLFGDYWQEQFLAMYGMLTGTASTGIVLLREIDKDFKTPASDNLVFQNFPAIVLGFPIMFLATLAPVKPVLTLIIFIVFFAVLNIFLFRSKIFKNKK